MQPAFVDYYSETDYLSAERAAPIRHEYVAGEVFAMAAASKVHGTLALNAAIVLRQHLRGAPCRVWMADMKVRVKADSAYYYPDVVVTCDATDLGPDAPKDYVEAPKLVLEVLSDSTEPVDRREKLLSYRRLESLEEYVLIDQNKAWVEVYRRTPAGWVQEVYEAGASVRLASVDLAVPLADLYADSGIEMVAVCPS
ncbi:MAG: Uma2 family endonuclease [Gallionellaceae bacterium]|nr:Uma2 family endonuclease [Gallionellaceae bacterium]